MLAIRAEKRAASGLNNADHGTVGPTLRTGPSVPSINGKTELELPFRPVRQMKVPQRCPSGGDARQQGRFYGINEPSALRFRKRPGRSTGVDFGGEKGLVGIDIPDPGHCGLIEQKVLDWLCSTMTASCQVYSTKTVVQGFRPESESGIGTLSTGVRGDNANLAEPAHVRKAQRLPRPDFPFDAVIRSTGSIGRNDAERTAHPEMQYEPHFVGQVNEKILTAPADVLDSASDDLRFQVRHGHGTPQTSAPDAYATDGTPHKVR